MSSSSPALSSRPVLVPRPSVRDAGWLAPVVVRLSAFAALCIYGAVRWGSMLRPAPTGRLLGLVTIAVALAAVGPLLARRRSGAVAATVVAGIAMLAVSGLPMAWIRHVRIAVSADAIGRGLSALPRLLMPYSGLNQWVHLILLLGAAVLLLDAAVMMAFARSPGPSRGDLRRAVTALPLVVLATVPLTMVPARLPALQGLLMFVLLVALVWGERLVMGRARPALLGCAVAAVAALVLAPGFHPHTPWFNYRSWAGAIEAGSTDAFDWSQSYGPINWPRDGREVLNVAAKNGDYWKAVNLDVFDGVKWTQGAAGPGELTDTVSAAALKRWTRRLTVTIGSMTTSDIIGSGDISAPTGAAQTIYPSPSAGRFVSATPLGPGDSYTVSAYSPRPSAAQLAAAGTAYHYAAIANYLSVALPQRAAAAGQGPVVYVPPFGNPSSTPFASVSGTDGRALIANSPYAPVLGLAQRLRARAATPYDYVQGVLRYLSVGYRYDENPPARPYPLASFLLHDRRGYCQQFAGAMALLLRLGGVPARVAAGFTPGRYDSATHRWRVTDYDAHAWVEAFFPAYGWVRFDPTPPSAPARNNNLLPISPGAGAAPKSTATTAAPGTHGLGKSTASTTAKRHGTGGGLSLALLPLAVLALLALTALATSRSRPLTARTPEQLVAELERAYARTRRPLEANVTLGEIERRLHDTPEAQEYVRAISRLRFAPEGGAPTRAQRRALRGQLRSGLGMAGALRALWALPPSRPRLRWLGRAATDGRD